MKLLIELPTWLGDSVMATPAVESLLERYPDAEVTLFGAFAATELFREHPRISRIVVDSSRNGGGRLLRLYRLAKGLDRPDLALSFRSHLFSRLLLRLSGAPRRHLYRKKGRRGHQVEKYQQFINEITGKAIETGTLSIRYRARPFERPTLGINPGAAYGSAKQWYPERFAAAALQLAERYDIVIFGGTGEKEVAADIEAMLRSGGTDNVTNLAGKTTIAELCETIGGLDLFITGDSGPMHIAAAYKIPTVALFGPTRHDETSPWRHPHHTILRHEMACSPCMKRECPLKHHDCMKRITVAEVVSAAKRLG